MARTGQQLRVRTAKAMADSGRPSVKTATEKKSGLGDRLRYMFDNSMSSGTPALVAWLIAATLLLIIVFSVILAITGMNNDGTDRGPVANLFYNLLHALDPGTVGGDSGTWPYLLTMLLLTLGGLFIVSALIGVLATGIDSKLADLRRGRSIVLEEEHTVILGWSESIFTIISELTLANESRKDPVIVILADRDKVDMEEELKVKVPERRGTKIICRSGSPMDLDDLRLSSHDTARSVILLAPDSDDPDSEVIKTLLALTHAGTDGPRIVAEIQDPSNLEAAALVGKGRTTLLDIRETVAKLVVQTSRQSGAAAVYTELFDYSGDEFYFFEEHGLAGSTYAEAQQAFEAASVVGIVDGATSKLNPPADTVLTADQTLIVVVEDDSALEGQSRSMTEPALNKLGQQSSDEARPTQALLIGWNDRAPIVLARAGPLRATRLDADRADGVRRARRAALSNLAVTVVKASSTNRAVLEEHVGADLDQIIVLCYDRDLEAQAADSRTLVSAAPRARHPAQGRLGDPGGQRDDGRPQPDPRLGRRRRRHRGQRRDRVAPGHPALRGRSARGGLQGAARCRGQRDLPAARRVVRPAGRPTSAGPPSWPARRAATRPRSGSSRRCWPSRGSSSGWSSTRRSRRPTRSVRATRSWCWRRTSVIPRGRRLAGPARCHRVERVRPAHVDHGAAAHRRG